MKKITRQSAEKKLRVRPPVVVVLGHIDHGKTSLLDQIRKTHVAEKESGGITQHIGAYQIEHRGRKITFIDTPGHEAFSAIRSRGAKVADIAILVIDASEGVKAQTKEAISHIKKSEISFIVALNKIDKPGADPERVKKELTKEDVLVESLGGKIPSVLVSAKTGEGIPDLLELIILIAEMEDLKENIEGRTEGVIIEAYLDNKRGPIATLLLNQGILKTGDIVVTLSSLGKIKKLEDFQGKTISEIGAATPAILLGFEDVPKVGEKIQVCTTLEEARANVKISEEKEVQTALEISPDQKALNLIVKADVKGSIEGILEVLKNLPQEKVVLQILKSKVGEINESDLKLAKETEATVLAFRVKMNQTAQILAEREKIRIIKAEIIYDLVEAIRKLMEKVLKPKLVRSDLGKVKVLVIFMTEKNRQIIGGKVIEGEVEKGAKIEVFRPASPAKRGEEDELMGKGKIINLQRNKKDIPRLPKGEECGILYEGNVNIEKGDSLVIYKEEKIKEEL